MKRLVTFLMFVVVILDTSVLAGELSGGQGAAYDRMRKSEIGEVAYFFISIATLLIVYFKVNFIVRAYKRLGKDNK